MGRRSESVRLFDFSGGLNSAGPITSLSPKEANDLQNINLLSSGGFEKRRGNTAFNSSAMASGAAVHGIGYYRQADGDDWLVAITGTGIFKADSLDGTMDDITGAVTITTGQNNIWTHTVMNDLSIWVGGAPNAPIKWSGSGNAAALGGSPPSGNFGIQMNNYFFIGNTSSNPSRIQWSILGDPENWTGTGSGTQDVSKNDGDTLIGAAAMEHDRLLLFKQNSIHELIARNPTFPVYPLFRGIGAVGKNAIVVADGLAYFVTPQPRMKATDGNRIFTFPDTIDNVWDGLNSARLQYIQGLYYPRLRQIWWIASNGSSSTNNYCIIWDLERKVWLRHTSGYGMNVVCLAQERTAYGGAYDGKIYNQDKASTYTDASEASPGTINAYWRSGWLDMQQMLNAKFIPYVGLNYATQTLGTFDLSYGFDFSQDRVTESVNMQAAGGKFGSAIFGMDVFGGVSDFSKLCFIKGAGNFFQFLIRNSNPSEALSFNGLELPMKKAAPSVLK